MYIQLIQLTLAVAAARDRVSVNATTSVFMLIRRILCVVMRESDFCCLRSLAVTVYRFYC